MKTVLILNFNYMGDTLMDSVAHTEVATRFQTDVLSFDFNREVLEGNPYWNEIHLCKKNIWLQMWKCLQLRGKYDLAIQFNTSFKTNFLMWLIGAKERIGYAYKWKGLLLTKKIPIDHPTLTCKNRIDEGLELLNKAFGWNAISKKMIFVVPSYRDYVVICPSPRQHYDTRRWDKFAELADEIVRKYCLSIIFVGAEEHKWYIENIRMSMKATSINLAGKLTVRELAYLLLKSDLVVTVNTFTMHLARALNCRTVAIIGRTPAEVITMPSENFKYVEDREDLSRVSVKQVIEKIEELI